MKILNLKYKMHKLVNLVFYLIIFGVGFLLGFGAEKINFNKLISQFLFIDNVSAEELICTESENLFNIEDVLINGYGNGATFSLACDNNCLIVNGFWKFVDYDIILEPGTYYLGVESISGAVTKIEVRIFNEETQNYDIYLFPLYDTNREKLIIDKETSIQFRFYGGMSSSQDIKTIYTTPFIVKETCELEKPKDVFVDIIDDSFYSFAQKIFGEVNEENKFIYDFITLGLVVICFTLFVLVIGYIFKKFFGG